MSFLTRAVVMSAVGAVLAVQAFAVEPREDRGKGLAIAIAATSEQTGVLQVDHKEGFLVVLTNRSEKPIRLWKQECRLGYGTLSFEVSDDKTGERTRMHKHPLKWANVRKGRHQVLTIPPAGSSSFSVHPWELNWSGFGWENAPEPNTGMTMTLTAVLEITPSEEAAEYGAWNGRVTSEPVKMLFVAPDLDTPHKSLLAGCPKQAIRLMQADPTWVSRTNDNQETPLHVAARYGPLEVVQWLLSNGADANARAYNQFAPLHLAKDAQVAGLLLKHGAEADADGVGGTPLHNARDPQVVKVLLERGARGGTDEQHNETPLELAARNYAAFEQSSANREDREREWAITRLLLNAGVNYNIRAACYLDDMDRVRAILKEDKTQALDRYAMRAAAEYGHAAIVKLLLENGADPEDADYDSLTVSYFAIERSKVLGLLFDAGADPKVPVDYQGNGWGPTGLTLLHVAAGKGAVESAGVLLAYGVDVDMTTPDGLTPLHHACEAGQAAMVEFLLRNKADPRAGAEDGWTPMAVAASAIRPESEDCWFEEHGFSTETEQNTGRVVAIRALQRAGVDIDLPAAIACDDIEQVAKILKSDPKAMTTLTPDGESPLSRAVKLNHANIVRLLLDQGCSPEIRNQDVEKKREGTTPLIEAAFWGHREIARMLIERGADVNASVEQGHTPLREAVRCNYIEVVQLLLEHKADINAAGADGKTPLDWANYDGKSPDMTRLLFRHGARHGAPK